MFVLQIILLKNDQVDIMYGGGPKKDIVSDGERTSVVKSVPCRSSCYEFPTSHIDINYILCFLHLLVVICNLI